jgi:hypothetical protein
MITADTITDEQILALRDSLVEYDPANKLAIVCNIAIGRRRGIARIEARARCADIINAREVPA